ncbi:hypothetical protein FQA39_LY11227 [Lamprigera yunnana]|nr:hypothetical protein FQA39_LY11227 [Lamprigera yunnana]
MSITELKAQRCKIKTAITRHETAVNEIKEENDYLNLEVCLSNLEHLFCDFNKIQTEIENLEICGKEENEIKSIIEKNQPYYIRVESQYFATVAKIKRILLNNKEQNQAQLEHQQVDEVAGKIRASILEVTTEFEEEASNLLA